MVGTKLLFKFAQSTLPFFCLRDKRTPKFFTSSKSLKRPQNFPNTESKFSKIAHRNTEKSLFPIPPKKSLCYRRIHTTTSHRHTSVNVSSIRARFFLSCARQHYRASLHHTDFSSAHYLKDFFPLATPPASPPDCTK